MTYIAIIIGSIFVSNIILSSFLGICPFLGISKNPKNALGMGGALIFVIFGSSMLCYGIYHGILHNTALIEKYGESFDFSYLKLVVFILVIAAFVQFVEFFMKKYMKGLYKALGIYLPLITTNCVVLQVAQDVVGINKYTNLAFNFPQAIVYAISIAVGYTLVITLFSMIRVRIDGNENTPKAFKGNAIALVTTALLVLAFAAFNGLI